MPPAPGTVNISYNTSKEERDVLGQAAFQDDRSIGSLIRRLLLKGAEIEDPELAESLKKARLSRYTANAAVAIVGLTAVFQVTLGQQEVQRGFRSRLARPSVRREFNLLTA